MSVPANKSEMNLYEKMAHIMTLITGVHKGANVSTGANGPSYRAVSHDDVTALIHLPCAEMGVIIIPSISKAETNTFDKPDKYGGVKTSYRVDLWVDVTFINADKPEERFVSSSFSYAIDSGDKATGKAYSMAVKYSYLKAFMLESYDEEESREYEHKQTYQKTATPVKEVVKVDDQSISVIDLIRSRMKILTEGKPVEEMRKAVPELLGVGKFDELKSLTITELRTINKKLGEIVESNKGNENKVNHSFKI